ncbi:MAG: hypothetical protein K2W82_16705 [Candidatus Obscuribacterales bacterium]|nr:hypothetical protein [Candidatus Obscuribacterales bacterium]
MFKQMLRHSAKFGFIMAFIAAVCLFTALLVVPEGPKVPFTAGRILMNLARIGLVTAAAYAIGWAFANWTSGNKNKQAIRLKLLFYTALSIAVGLITLTFIGQNIGLLARTLSLIAVQSMLMAVPFAVGYYKFTKLHPQPAAS